MVKVDVNHGTAARKSKAPVDTLTGRLFESLVTICSPPRPMATVTSPDILPRFGNMGHDPVLAHDCRPSNSPHDRGRTALSLSS